MKSAFGFYNISKFYLQSDFLQRTKVVFILVILLAVSSSCKQSDSYGMVYETDDLKIVQLTENSYQHITYLATEDFGKVACNGLIYINDGEAAVFDTPSEDHVSKELISWIEDEKKAEVKALIVNHFHNDCLGGIRPFHAQDIPSYANELTIALAKQDSVEAPKNGFSSQLTLEIGRGKVINQFPGHAHSPDNIVSYLPLEKVLFGGCMVKSLKSGKGYLGDADTLQWSATVSKIEALWPELNIVIPGHGKTGGIELLDYTVEMFNTTNQ